VNDLYLAFSYETASGRFAGLLLGLAVVLWSFLSAPKYFHSTVPQKIFVLSVVVRFVLICLSVARIFNPPASDLVWFEIDAARIAMGVQPLVLSIASADNFEAFHAALFYVFGASFFLADMVGLAGYALSVIFLARFVRLLKLTEFEPLILLPFCFLPGSLIFLNYNAREVFQVLFLILTMHGLVKYRQDNGILSLGMATLWGYLFAITHNRYIVVVPAIIAIGLFLPKVTQARSATWQRIALFPFAIGLLLIINFVSSGQGFLSDVGDQGLINYVSDLSYRGGDLSARTQFPFLLTSTDPATFLLALPVMMAQFVLAPLIPFIIKAPVDIFPAIDTAVRLLYLYGTVRLIQNAKAPGALRDSALFLLTCYFLFCGISLLGTLNVGTQERHQLKIEWVLLLAGAPVIASIFSRRSGANWRRRLKTRRQVQPVFRIVRSESQRPKAFSDERDSR